MKALNERQRLFVLAILDQGSKPDATAAAKKAGYATESTESLWVQAHRLSHDNRVQSAILEEARKRLQTGTIAAVSLLMETISDETADRGHRLKAAQMLLDRGGLHVLTEHRIDVVHSDDRDEKIKRIIELANEMRMNPRALLGNMADIQETDFTLIEGEAKVN